MSFTEFHQVIKAYKQLVRIARKEVVSFEEFTKNIKTRQVVTDERRISYEDWLKQKGYQPNNDRLFAEIIGGALQPHKSGRERGKLRSAANQLQQQQANRTEYEREIQPVRKTEEAPLNLDKESDRAYLRVLYKRYLRTQGVEPMSKSYEGIAESEALLEKLKAATQRYGTSSQTLKPENVRMIGYNDGSFYVSEFTGWKDFNYVLNNEPQLLTWIGSPGWFHNDKNKAIYEWLDKRYHLSGGNWSPGEFMEVGS